MPSLFRNLRAWKCVEKQLAADDVGRFSTRKTRTEAIRVLLVEDSENADYSSRARAGGRRGRGELAAEALDLCHHAKSE